MPSYFDNNNNALGKRQSSRELPSPNETSSNEGWKMAGCNYILHVNHWRLVDVRWNNLVVMVLQAASGSNTQRELLRTGWY